MSKGELCKASTPENIRNDVKQCQIITTPVRNWRETTAREAHWPEVSHDLKLNCLSISRVREGIKLVMIKSNLFADTEMKSVECWWHYRNHSKMRGQAMISATIVQYSSHHYFTVFYTLMTLMEPLAYSRPDREVYKLYRWCTVTTMEKERTASALQCPTRWWMHKICWTPWPRILHAMARNNFANTTAPAAWVNLMHNERLDSVIYVCSMTYDYRFEYENSKRQQMRRATHLPWTTS